MQSQWWESLGRFQAECPDIPKDSRGHGYRYASLPNLLGVVRPVLAKHGFVARWSTSPVEGGGVEVTCWLRHKAGHIQTASIAIHPKQVGGRMSEVQAVGAGITYAKRYALTSLLGLEPDEDSDGTASGRAGSGGRGYAPDDDDDL